MKNASILILFIVFLSFSSTAQYKKIDFYNTYWNLTLVQPDMWTQCDDYYYYSYVLKKDTVINSLVYHKVGPTTGIHKRVGGCTTPTVEPYSWNDFHFLRQDSAKKLILILDPSFKERIFYNFSKTVGDTLIRFDTFFTQMRTDTVVAIDSVLLGNNLYHKRFQLKDSYASKYYIIEGVGGEFDLLHPIRTAHHPGPSLITFRQCVSTITPSIRLFPNPLGGPGNTSDCPMIFAPAPTTNLAEHKTRLELRLAPNPVVDELRVTCDENIRYLNIQNITGSRVKQYHSSESSNIINVSDLSSGIYFLQVETFSGLHQCRFVKQ